MDANCSIMNIPILLVFFLLLKVSSAESANYTTLLAPGLAAQFLKPHNAARAALRMPPLVWDARLARYAEWWAKQRRVDCALRHSNGPYGENIFWGSGTGWVPAQAVATWVSERRWYNHWSNSCVGDQVCGHYTQIVWRETRRIGCAKVVCFGGGGTFMTCNYDPPGNYMGEWPY